MEYHRISFIHNDTEYSFVKAMSSNLTGYALVTACRAEVTILHEREQPERLLYIDRNG